MNGLAARLRRVIPTWAADLAVRLKGPVQHQIRSSLRYYEGLLGGVLPERSEYEPRWPVTLGIFRDRAGFCTMNVLACREMGVPFTLLDLEAPDWWNQTRAARCDGFLVWPSTNLRLWKDLYDERIRFLTSVLRRPVVPSPEEVWLFERKRRVADWLKAHDVPHPRTVVLFDRGVALDWVKRCALPVVLKTDAGASSHGVFVLRKRHAAERLVRRAFESGIRLRRGDAREKAWGYALMQEYVEHSHEWRVVRIGDAFLCRRKERVGDFASGAARVEWAWPPRGLLDFAEMVTDIGGFRSMALDVFETADDGDDRFLVNEMQCLVGPAPVQEHPARGLWRKRDGAWTFVAGNFYRNACANLRVALVLRDLGLAPEVTP